MLKAVHFLTWRREHYLFNEDSCLLQSPHIECTMASKPPKTVKGKGKGKEVDNRKPPAAKGSVIYAGLASPPPTAHLPRQVPTNPRPTIPPPPTTAPPLPPGSTTPRRAKQPPQRSTRTKGESKTENSGRGESSGSQPTASTSGSTSKNK